MGSTMATKKMRFCRATSRVWSYPASWRLGLALCRIATSISTYLSTTRDGTISDLMDECALIAVSRRCSQTCTHNDRPEVHGSREPSLASRPPTCSEQNLHSRMGSSQGPGLDKTKPEARGFMISAITSTLVGSRDYVTNKLSLFDLQGPVISPAHHTPSNPASQVVSLYPRPCEKSLPCPIRLFNQLHLP